MIQKKVCLLGSFAVGKTSLVSRFVHSIFSEQYHTTVGVKIEKKSLELDGQKLNLIIWDLAGKDKFEPLRPSFLRGTSGYLLVVDPTREHSWSIAQEIVQQAEELLGPVPFLCLLNKHDLSAQWFQDLEDFKEQQPEWSFLTTSAKTGEHVEESFIRIGRQCLNPQ